MFNLIKVVAVLIAFRLFVFDLVAPYINLTNSAQLTVIVCFALVATVFGIVFVTKK